MNKIKFVKMHGLGNDFVILDRRKKNISITKSLVSKLSNRKTGAGCDQLITIDNSKSVYYSASIKIYNPNGDEAEACGNGTRCVAKLLFKEKKSKIIRIKSKAGILKANKINNHIIGVNLGKITSEWKKIPLSKKIDTLNLPIKLKNFSNGIAVNVGNPHVVFIGKNINNFNLKKYGSKIEKNILFPKKTNVEIVEVINKKTIKIRVWERGAGITLACGSGACAAVYACYTKGLILNHAKVIFNNGYLKIRIEKGEAILEGPAEISYKGYIEV